MTNEYRCCVCGSLDAFQEPSTPHDDVYYCETCYFDLAVQDDSRKISNPNLNYAMSQLEKELGRVDSKTEVLLFRGY